MSTTETKLPGPNDVGPAERGKNWGGWAGENLGPLLRGEDPPSPPTVLTTDDGALSLFYPGTVNMLFSQAGSWKTWLALVASVQQTTQHFGALFFDYEAGATTVYERVAQMGLDWGAISPDANHHFRYYAPAAPFDDEAKAMLSREHEPNRDEEGMFSTVAVIDGVTAAMSLQGLDPNVGVDFEQFLNGLPRYLAGLGMAVILNDHTGLGGNVRRPIGSERKLSGIDGAAYGLETVVPFGRGRTGRARIRLRRDKHGHIARLAPIGKAVAEIELRSDPETGAVTYSLTLPAARGGSDDDVEALTERTLAAIVARPGLSKRDLRSAVGGTASAVDLAVAQLAGEGLVRVDQGERGRQAHYPKDAADA